MAGLTLAPQVIASVALFDGVDTGRIDRIFPAMDAFSAKDGDYIFRQNDEARYAYIVDRGEVAILGRLPGDEVYEIARFGHGEVFGELALLDTGRRSAEARAVGDVSGWRINVTRFEAICMDECEVALAILRKLQREAAARTCATINTIADMLKASPASNSGEKVPTTPAQSGVPAAGSLLGTFPGFREFGPDSWETFDQSVQRIDCSAGDVLEKQGTIFSAVYVVARGALQSSLQTAKGHSRLMLHGPGRLAGAGAVVLGGDWPASLIARENSIVYKMPAKTFHRLLGSKLTADESELARKLLPIVNDALARDLRHVSRSRVRLQHIDSAMAGAA